MVRDIAGRTTGCSLGISADWVVVQAGLFDAGRPHEYDETVLVHELGHALNLPHHPSSDNLMYYSSSPPDHLRGTRLNVVAADRDQRQPPRGAGSSSLSGATSLGS